MFFSLCTSSSSVMAHNQTSWLAAVLFTILTCFSVSSSAATDAQILLTFKNSLSNVTALNNWVDSVPPCTNNTNNWAGLICIDGGVYGLQLESMGLMGFINIDSLVDLPALRTLSFMNNSFDGPLPDVRKLGKLKSVFFSYNQFPGEIPADAFAGMVWLKKVYLARNQFTGKIPKSLGELPKLLELSVEGNQFEGEIPGFQQKELKTMNFANNKLKGQIPTSLSKFNSSSFSGNSGLCGKPFEPCKSSLKRRIILIAAAVAAVLLLAVAAIFYFRRRRQPRTPEFKQTPAAKAPKKFGAYETGRKEPHSPDNLGTHNQTKPENGKLYFVRNGIESFELQDLLRASAEVLGSGSFGSSYKAVLLGGAAMVVKRFRQMSNVGKEEFHEHMRRLGRLSHPNLLPLVAFYYTKEEKLLVSEFVGNGSLASHLHAKRGPGQAGLDWPARLKIIKGVAKGLAYLYQEFPDIPLPHGHLKSSNVLLDYSFHPLLSDYALVPVVNRDHAQQLMVAYKSPESTQNDRTTKKTDVWTLGILILELLTGKFPANYLKQGKGANADLASWVNSVVREEWTGEVFDKEMKNTKNGEGGMLQLLKIGMCCCEWSVERRWDLREAVEKIEELKERDSDEEYSSYNSDGDVYSSRGMTEDDFSFSVNT